MSLRSISALLAAALLVLSGCGDDGETETEEPAEGEAASPTVPSVEVLEAGQDPAPLTLDLEEGATRSLRMEVVQELTGGEVGGQAIEAEPPQTVALEVESEVRQAADPATIRLTVTGAEVELAGGQGAAGDGTGDGEADAQQDDGDAGQEPDADQGNGEADDGAAAGAPRIRPVDAEADADQAPEQGPEDAPGPSPEQAPEQAPDPAEQLEGLALDIEVDERSRVEAVSPVDPSAVGDAVTAQILQLVQQQLLLAIVPLPAEDVGVGARWEVVREEAAGMPLTERTTVELVARDEEAYELDVTVGAEAEEGAAVPSGSGQELTIDELTREGEGSLTRPTGAVLPERMELSVDTVIGVSSPNQDASQRQDLSESLTIEPR